MQKRLLTITLLLLASHLNGSDKHFLTFIMPCYNRGNIIHESINSIYQQNLDIPFEVICTDDCSTDNTGDVLMQYAQKHKNFHVLFHDKNQGAAATRNTCMRYAQGDIIFNLDSDNVLVPDSVQGLIDLMDQTGCQATSFAEARYCTTPGSPLSYTLKYDTFNNLFDLHLCLTSFNAPGASGNYLFTRKSYDRAGRYPAVSNRDTWGFGFRQLATGTVIAIQPNTFYWHRVNHNDSNFMNGIRQGKTNKNTIKVLAEFPELFTQQTNDTIANYDISKDVYQAQSDGAFKLIPQEATTALFKAYAHEEQQQYSLAILTYQEALQKGAYHWKIYWRIAQAAYRSSLWPVVKDACQEILKQNNNYDGARSLLEKVQKYL